MQPPDPLLTRITDATTLHHQGNPEGARTALQHIWDELGDTPSPFHRCLLAHYMADTQANPSDEVAWDLRALTAAQSLTDAELKSHQPTMDLATLFPSLHLNLAEGYRKLGDLAGARAHIQQALSRTDALADDGYGQMIRAGIMRLAAELGATTPES